MDIEGNFFKLTQEEVMASGFPETFPISEAEERSCELVERARVLREDATELIMSHLTGNKARALELNQRSHLLTRMNTQLSRYVDTEIKPLTLEDELDRLIEDR